jgi:hypothetical protein
MYSRTWNGKAGGMAKDRHNHGGFIANSILSVGESVTMTGS